MWVEAQPRHYTAEFQTESLPFFLAEEVVRGESIAVAKNNFQKGRANLLVCSESPQRFPTFFEVIFGNQYISQIRDSA